MYWTMKEVQSDPDLKLQLIVTGMHLSPEFGLTYQAIERDGFVIDEKIDMLLSGDTPAAIAKSIGVATIGFADALQRLKPDILVLLGDRFEILAAAQAAMVARIPMAHLHGGESTEGAIDESIRHSITKMSHLHFTAADAYRKRVIQLGENPDHVHNVGALGIDHLLRTKLLERNELEEKIDFKLGAVNFMVTYHPVTLRSVSPAVPMTELLAALDAFPEAHILFTLPNGDTDGRVLIPMIRNYVEKNPGRTKCFSFLGQKNYLSAIKYMDVVIGNSSSGLIEVPAFQKATVNIGERQRGRLRADSVIDCSEAKEEIETAVQKALSPEFKKGLLKVNSPYGGGGAAVCIKDILKTAKLDGLLMKRFFDLS